MIKTQTGGFTDENTRVVQSGGIDGAAGTDANLRLFTDVTQCPFPTVAQSVTFAQLLQSEFGVAACFLVREKSVRRLAKKFHAVLEQIR
ncbi:hypothetical protein NK8_85690 (plasmid) [Caballeronia sp. NK8]|nr:hypothetical protein NK8_85690 [Caballeronia sp. NK8]